MIALDEAQSLICQQIKSLQTEKTSILEAYERVLAEDIHAPLNLPPFNRSPLDGYALQGEDTQGANPNQPCRLKIIEKIPAGYAPQKLIVPGTAARIFTGAPIPPGANTVVRQEDTREEQDEVVILQTVAPFSNFSRCGEDVIRGERVIESGQLLNPACIGMLASMGMVDVSVFQRPRVGIISTGDELVAPPQPLPIGKIYNSNLYTFAGLVARSGGLPKLYPTVVDQVSLQQQALRQALQENDLVITTGGVSVGEFDVVNEAIEALGGTLLFWRIAMKPGTPALAAKVGDKLVIALSGNPAAATITYHLLVHPAIQLMGGCKELGLTIVQAKSEDVFSKTSGQRRFLRAKAYHRDGQLWVKLTGKQNPGVLKSMLYSNALIDLPPRQALTQGDMVNIILLPF
jgi:molybdopterin molybdotransferase